MTELKIKIYTERNTGSRYLTELVQHNLSVELLRGDVPRIIRKLSGSNEALRDIYFKLTFHRNLGWKHTIAPTAERLKNLDIREIRFLTLTKNLYSWLLSLYRRPYHQEQEGWDSFTSFLLSPWKTVKRENYSNSFPNPIVMWNEKNRSYLNLKSFACSCSLRYEDLLENPELVLNKIVTQFSIPKKASFENLTQSTKRDEGKDFDYYRRYYLEEQWKDQLTSTDLKIINTYLDHDLMTRFGYSILE